MINAQGRLERVLQTGNRYLPSDIPLITSTSRSKLQALEPVNHPNGDSLFAAMGRSNINLTPMRRSHDLLAGPGALAGPAHGHFHGLTLECDRDQAITRYGIAG